jgi:ABC-type transporter Mla subunit MlaD
MQEQPSKGERSDRAVDIDELARRLREAEHLEPEAREKVAGLLRELSDALEQAEPSPHTEDLTQSTAQLMQAVKDQHEPGLIEAARERLEEAVARAESKAPVATDVVLRLIDALAGAGI